MRQVLFYEIPLEEDNKNFLPIYFEKFFFSKTKKIGPEFCFQSFSQKGFCEKEKTFSHRTFFSKNQMVFFGTHTMMEKNFFKNGNSNVCQLSMVRKFSIVKKKIFPEPFEKNLSRSVQRESRTVGVLFRFHLMYASKGSVSLTQGRK